MKNAETLVAGIEYKVRKLLERNGLLHKENEQLKNEVTGLKTNMEDLERNIFELKEKITTLKLAKTLNKEESRTEVKLKINELMREIDHCVGLLNK